jgi:hypothetical protein
MNSVFIIYSKAVSTILQGMFWIVLFVGVILFFASVCELVFKVSWGVGLTSMAGGLFFMFGSVFGIFLTRVVYKATIEKCHIKNP